MVFTGEYTLGCLLVVLVLASQLGAPSLHAAHESGHHRALISGTTRWWRQGAHNHVALTRFWPHAGHASSPGKAVVVASAPSATTTETAIRELLDRYGAALTARNVDQVVTLMPGLSEAGRQKVTDYFDFARDLKVQISDVEVMHEGDWAVVTFKRKDEFTDRKSGRTFVLEAVLTATLCKVSDGGWQIVGLGE
jgi:ketosteroid isomerase-like protein